MDYLSQGVTLDTGVYASGDQLGSLITFNPNGDIVNLKIVTIIDKAKVDESFDILFFRDEPTITSVDNAALNIADSELAEKFLGHVTVTGTDFVDLSAAGVATYQVNFPIQTKNGKFYAILRSNGTGTYAADGLQINLGYTTDA